MKYIILMIFCFSVYKVIEYMVLDDDDQDRLLFWWCVGLVSSLIEIGLLL